MVEIHSELDNNEELENEALKEETSEATEEQTAESEEEKSAESEEKLEEGETAEEAAEENSDASDEKEGGENAPKEREMKWAKKAKASIKEKVNEEENKLKEVEEKYQRLFAEFDNFRKRSEKEKSAKYDMGAKDVIEKILPILDNFERGFDSVEESDKEDAFVTGMDLIYKQFMTTLEDMGVKPIEALGKEFNPDFHNAVMHVDDPEAGQNIIVEEFQKGYTYKDQVVRYSMVKVAN